MTGRRRVISATAGAALGGVLFAYALQRVGIGALVEGIRRVGWGLVAILGIAGMRFVLRAQCWRWCLPPAVRLDFPHAFAAFVAGDAVGNITPLGMFASEPTKVLLIRHHLATIDSVASLTIENLLYSISVMLMLAIGLVLLLATVAMPDPLRLVAVMSLAVTVVASAGAAAALRTPASGANGRGTWRDRFERLRFEVAAFARQHPSRLARVFSLQVLFHVLAILETWLTLEWIMGAQSPTVVQAFLFETVNRFTTVAFKFVPFRIGIDEATSGAIAPLLAVTATAGVTLAVIRKARVLFWSAVGLILLARHPARTS